MGWRVQYSIPGRDGMIEGVRVEKRDTRGGRERERESMTHHSIIRYKIAEITKYLGLLPG